MSIKTSNSTVRIKIISDRANGWVVIQTQGWYKLKRIIHRSEIIGK